MTTNIVIQQPGPTMIMAQSSQWSTGICDCFDDMADCCCGFWFLPCYACKVSKDHGECTCLPLLEFAAFGYGACIPAISLAVRVSVRRTYGIQGTICNDCLHASFCYPCSWCQVSREIKARQSAIVYNRTIT
ncbi:cornifelin homolog B-like [Brienomyrus brachyistius]|uniref:cornifelin homolog B-like n=1 Tax=Brienomyrus brachyistius TaxID=42636 RepID=UPI0020B26C5E|nr:cornifelin homolog B-like [Brienomyrus brachyistius]